MALRPNYSIHLSHKTRIAEIAKKLGYVQVRDGKTVGNIRALLKAIGTGEIKLVRPGVAQHQDQADLTIQQRHYERDAITDIKPLSQIKMQPVQRVKITGKPASQTLIEDRR